MLPGQQIVLDLYNCNFDQLRDPAALEEAARKAMGGLSLPVTACFTRPHDTGEGFSLVVFHDNGHVVAHTFPALGYASVDVLSTLPQSPVDKVAVALRRALKAEKAKHTFLRRCDFGSLNDMKPTIKKHTKAWRRVRNTGTRVFNIIKNKKPTVD